MKIPLIFALMASITFLTALFIFGCTGDPIEEEKIEEEFDDPNAIKGAIIGYAAGWRPAPTDAQLDRLNHVIVFQIIPNADGSLRTNAVPNWLSDFATRAKAKGVRVSIAVGGWTSESPQSPSFASAASDTYRAAFVNNLITFVNDYNLDGLDVDWEYPQGTSGWSNFMKLCNDLRAAKPGIWLTTALSGQQPTVQNYTSVVQQQIWTALDAIHLMSYDMQGSWPTHSDAVRSAKLIDDWAAWGNGQANFNKEKLILGCAFYGYRFMPDTTFQVAYNSNNFDDDVIGTDTPASLKRKVDHCYDKGYGGVMIWELSQDKNISTTPELLDAIYQATKNKGGYTGK